MVVVSNPRRLGQHAPAMPPPNRKVGLSYAVLIRQGYTEGACRGLIQYLHEPPVQVQAVGRYQSEGRFTC